VMRADDLDHAIELQNATPFGLTGGIHSLDEDEVDRWLRSVEVGNAYVNRHITGAVVQRQPFGGWKRSSIGGGVKAGGPDYVLGLTNVVDDRPPTSADAEKSFEEWWTSWFGVDQDPTGLLSQRNILRYRPVTGVLLRISRDTDREVVAVAEYAARRCNTPVHVSVVEEEGEEIALGRLAGERIERVRSLCPVSDAFRSRVLDSGVGLDLAPVSSHGRIELPHWLKEQAISETTHRYGRLTASVFDDPT